MSNKSTVQGLYLVDLLAKRPGMTAAELQARVASKFGEETMAVFNLIAYVRNRAGDEVIVCEHVKGKGYTYRLALTAPEAFAYLTKRKIKVRNEAANLVGILDRVDVKWPGDPQVRMARAMLESVVRILDAT